MQNVVETLLQEEEKSKIIINGKEFKVGKLKLKTVLKLSNIIAKFCVKQSNKFKNFKQGETNTDDLISFFELFDENELAKVISILVDTEDIEFCKEIDFESFTDLIIAVCEHNDFNKILGNIKRVIGLIKEKTEKIADS